MRKEVLILLIVLGVFIFLSTDHVEGSPSGNLLKKTAISKALAKIKPPVQKVVKKPVYYESEACGGKCDASGNCPASFKGGCDNGICTDPVCKEEESPNGCSDGADNNVDGKRDCADPGCATDPICLETSTNNNCADLVDNDFDKLIDCQDSGCSTDPNCLFLAYCGKYCSTVNATSNLSNNTILCTYGGTCQNNKCSSSLCVESIPSNNCRDAVDNDADNLIDCQDPGCVPSSYCPLLTGPESQSNFNCADGKDNDYDNKVDCLDSSCFGAPICFAETPWVPVGYASPNTICYDLADNDQDGLTDGKDPDCFEIYNEGKFVACFDGSDNDLDGATDRSDTDCSFFIIESNGKGCIDGVDNDGNGLQDCGDPVCATHNLCGEAGNSCWDGVDNNNDGGVDCSPYKPDQSCVASGACMTQETGKCSDGMDNDWDQLRDCNDPDCVGDSLCSCVDSDTQNNPFIPGDVTFVNPFASPMDRYDKCPPQGAVVPNYVMELTCNGATRYNTPGWQTIDCRTLPGATKGVCLNNRCV